MFRASTICTALLVLGAPVMACNWEDMSLDLDFAGYGLVELADFNQDQRPDLYIYQLSNGSCSWFENPAQSQDTWIQHSVRDTGAALRGSILADLDGDNDVDVLLTSDVFGYVSGLVWLENRENMGQAWIEHPVGPEGEIPPASPNVACADLDMDGDKDLLATYSAEQPFSWWENLDGDGLNWQQHVLDPDQENFNHPKAADMDGDGDTDLVASSLQTGAFLRWWENADGEGGAWVEHVVESEFSNITSLRVADLDGDGHLDLLAGRNNLPFGDGLVWWENDQGNGSTWTHHVMDANTDWVSHCTAQDLDGDGDLDVLSAASGQNVFLWENSGASPPVWTQYLIPLSDSRIHVADLNVDGALDLVNGFVSTNSLGWAENGYPLRVTTPGHGTQWQVGTEQNITWSTCSTGSLDIELIVDGNVAQQIATGIPFQSGQDDSFTWTVPSLDLASDCRIQLRVDVDGQEWLRLSDGSFSPGNPLHLGTPVTESSWQPGETVIVHYTSSIDSPLQLEVIQDGLAVWVNQETLPAAGPYSLTVPQLEMSGNYQLRLRTQDQGVEYQDDSPASFTLVNPVELLTPNGGEIWDLQIGGEISWISSQAGTSTLELYRDGLFLHNLAEDMPGTGSWSWEQISHPAGGGYSVRVVVAANGFSYSDDSDSPFSLTIPGIILHHVAADTTHPSFVNLVFRASTADGAGIGYLGELDLYQLRENGHPISPTESVPALGQLGEIPFVHRTLLMLDNSFSIGQDLEQVRAGARQAVREMFPGQELALWTFAETVTQMQDFTADTSLLLDAIDDITLGTPSTNLYGAVITGIAELQSGFSQEGILESAMLLMTDGEDTQGSETLQAALTAVQGKQVYSIAVGDAADTAVLQQLGTAGFLDGDFEQLPGLFGSIQQSIQAFANSFYWMVYISPSRNNPDVSLELSIPGNPLNSVVQVTFSSVGFSSVVPGVYLNRRFDALLGLDEIVFTQDAIQLDLQAETLFGLGLPSFTWQVDNPAHIAVNSIWGDQDQHATLQLVSEDAFVTNLSITDSANGFSLVLPIHSPGLSSLDEDMKGPASLQLQRIYPNPFNPSTQIEFSLESAGPVSLQVFNLRGQLQRDVFSSRSFPAGTHRHRLDASDLPSGVYFIRLSNGKGEAQVKKLALVR